MTATASSLVESDRLGQLARLVLRVEPASFALSTLWLAVPFWLTPELALTESPLYVSTFELLARGPVAGSEIRLDVASSLGPLVFVVGEVGTRVLGAELTYRLLLGLSVLALPWVLRDLASAIGRGRMLSWMALPLAYNLPVFAGDLRTALSLCACLSAVASAAWLMQRASRLRMAALFSCSVGACYMHPVLGVLSCLGALSFALAKGEAPRPVRVGLPLASLLSFVAVTAALSPGFLHAAASDFRFVPSEIDPSRRLEQLGSFAVMTLRAETAQQLSIAWICTSALVLILGVNGAGYGAAGRRRERACLLCVVALAMLAYLLVPPDFDTAWGFALPCCAVVIAGALCLVPLPARPFRGLSSSVFVAIAWLMPVQAMQGLQTASRVERGDLQAALDAVPDGAHLLSIIRDGSSRALYGRPFAYASAPFQARSPTGATAPSITDAPGWPLQLRGDSPRPPLDDALGMLTGYVYPATLAWSDYILTRGEWPARPVERTELVYRDAQWALWRVSDDTQEASSEPAP